MPALGSPSLDQLRTFVAVAEAGSFSAAARALNRQQSVVSYAIANLEEQLGGLKLFDRATRRPTLTEAGATLLAEARKVAMGVDGLRARATGLLAGLEAELAVVVDVMLPTPTLVEALAAFRTAFPTVTLRLSVEALGAVARLVLDGTCAVGVCGPLARTTPGLDHRPLGGVRLLPVAAPDHPLAQMRGPIPPAALRDHVQLVLADRSDLTRGQDFGVLSPETWRLGDLGAKHALLIGGLGWGGMPDAMVAGDVAAGRLIVLHIDGWGPVEYGIFAVHRSGELPGPAGRWFVDRLASSRF
ncbi:LysR family transcriptional regulator [Lichenibacterium minor]|uniref:LysR family transcriptional regulator n=1 Tax=Lichenibacterium minor TaxID=2316528 RepID=A0A4Q2U914_9HYPH|nr:LysR family transcriptional regulator [Lichenibacterium minor]RYC32990.1 LysR family transcriptional regulator [Lichenibacterium minor]